ncbi:MAG TPA: Na+/H+ antiporter NhaA [Burkholderiales bacterium]|nr:Na+/H+ antiporter NhaA [Burkholderiales bacterium]
MSELPAVPAKQRTSRELIEEFFRLEAAGGVILVIAALVALLWANTPWRELYTDLLHIPVVVQFGALRLDKPLLLWINDALMAVFFLLVGLEIKREVLQGELSSVRQAALPGIAALGGMLGPALIYSLINWGDPVAMRGWPIPAATDIAFALGVLAVLGARAPSTLKIFLLALAIIDDLGAIVIIALFYTEDLSLLSLGLGVTGIAALIVLNLAGVRRIAPYVLVGIFVWICVLKSGVHATLAGVALGFAIPLRGTDREREPPLRRLEHMLHPWVTYGILPVFAFANAGVALTGLSLNSLLEPVTLGVALGLFLGKQLSVFGITWIAVQLGIGRKPAGASWLQLYGMSVLTGIGFTMSLFIGTLAFEAPEYNVAVRLGVLSGSLACGIAGYLVLYLAPRR